MAGGSSSPCASCKLLRRRCAKDCIFAPYFPSDDPHKFAIVHKVFGASNVSKMLQELPLQQRADAVSSLVFEANARMRDPVYGCVGAISYLQSQISQLQMQLAVAQAEILCIQVQQEPASLATGDQPTLMAADQDKSFLFNNIISHNNNNNNNNNNLMMNNNSINLSQLLNYPASSTTNVIHDYSLRDRESLWT